MRDNNLTLARVVALALMILTHAAGPGFYTFGPHWKAICIFESFAHTAVPVFFMISGALLLGRSESTLAFYRKRYMRILPPLVAWSLLYIPVIALWPDPPAKQTAWTILTGPVSFHLWFVYTIASLYLLIPILRAFYSHASLTLKLIALLLAGISQTWDHFFKGVLALNFGVDMHLFPQYTFFMLAGAFIHEHRELLAGSRVKQVASFTLFIAMCGLTSWLVKHESIAAGAPREWFYSYNSMNILVPSVALFSFLLTLRISNLPRPIEDIADKSFGIYLSHWLFLGAGLYGTFYSWPIGFTLRWDTFDPIIAVPLVTVAGLVASYVLCSAIALIPLGKRLI